MSTCKEIPPELYGCYPVGQERRFLPTSRSELDRASEFYGNIIAGRNLGIERYVLVTATFDEAVQIAPFEVALAGQGLIACNAESTTYEAGRVASYLRRFDVCAVFGLNGALLDGLLEGGHQPEALFAGRTVWARPDAHARLVGLEGFKLLRWSQIGPAVGMECSEGAGLHVDGREWAVTEREGEVRLTSRLQRAMNFADVATGVRGSVDQAPCACGSWHPRVHL